MTPPSPPPLSPLSISTPHFPIADRLAMHPVRKMVALPMDNGRVKVIDQQGSRLARMPRNDDVRRTKRETLMMKKTMWRENKDK